MSRSAEKQRLRRLPHICHPAKYERTMGQVIGTLEPENRKVGPGVLKAKVRYSVYRVRPFRAVHDNVAVAVIVSQISSFENFLLNVCKRHKIGQVHPKLLWCNACTRPTNLPSTKTICNEPTLPCKGIQRGTVLGLDAIWHM